MKGFWLLVRIAGIVIGIATLLRVATNQNLVTYDPLFLAWMDRLRDFVELGFLTDVIHLGLQWGIDQVRGLGIGVPDLQDEWQPAFVFSTLLFGAMARNSSSPVLYLAAPAASLAVAIWSGLTGTLVPVAVVAAIYPAALYMSFRTSARDSRGLISGLFAAIVLAASVVTYAAFAPSFVTFVLNGLATVSPAVSAALAAIPASVVVAALVAAAGVGALQIALLQSLKGGAAVSESAPFSTGLDILFTMALAFVIAVVVANPPIMW